MGRQRIVAVVAIGLLCAAFLAGYMCHPSQQKRIPVPSEQR